MVEIDEAYRTTDLAKAAVFVAAGHRYKLERLNSTQACWVFDPAEGQEDDFENLWAAYDDSGCRVEPRSFMSEVGRMRSELYTFIGRPRR